MENSDIYTNLKKSAEALLQACASYKKTGKYEDLISARVSAFVELLKWELKRCNSLMQILIMRDIASSTLTQMYTIQSKPKNF